MFNFFNDKVTSIGKLFFTQNKTQESIGLNTLPNELKTEILNMLDYKSLQAMTCVSHSWEKITHTIPLYHAKEYYTYSGGCDWGMIRHKTIDIHFPNNGGSGPIFVPFPQIDIDCYRFTNPSRNEFLRAFVQEHYNNHPFELWRHKPDPQRREDREFPIFKVKLKRDVSKPLNQEQISCKVEDIQQLLSGEFTWYPKNHIGFFAAKPRHIHLVLNQYAPEIEKAHRKVSH